MTNSKDPLDLENLRLSPAAARANWAVVPRKIQKRRKHFVMVPWSWVEKLEGASGKTHQLALHLLHLNWKGKGAPFKLPNGMLKIDGMSRQAKWRSLIELEGLGLITVERSPRKSPTVRLNLSHP